MLLILGIVVMMMICDLEVRVEVGSRKSKVVMGRIWLQGDVAA